MDHNPPSPRAAGGLTLARVDALAREALLARAAEHLLSRSLLGAA